MDLKRTRKKIDELLMFPLRWSARMEAISMSLGRIESKLQEINPSGSGLTKKEFKVFSNAGEDGIIHYLTQVLDLPNKIFIEFGVQNYVESNTRFLLQHQNWAGLVIDGDIANILYIKKDPIFWRYNLKAEASFVTAENINSIILNQGISGDIGILSVDIDGVDYWVWKAINCISPRIVIAEYNSLFGPKASITVPYDPTFYRTTSHYSNLYFGASITALTGLAKEKGYTLVGGDSTGVNLFFVRNDILGPLKEVSIEETYVKCQFRQSRNQEGQLNYLGFEESVALIKDMPMYDLSKQSVVTLHQALNS